MKARSAKPTQVARTLQAACCSVLLFNPDIGAATLFLYDQGGDGRWHDVNKIYSGDSSLCWAASAANLLAWGGWGLPPLDTDQKIYGTFVGSWTDQPSLPMVGITWWLTGAVISYGSDWATVDVPGNGGYWPDVALSDYYLETTHPAYAGVAISHYLQQGYATSLAIYSSGHAGHSLTVWGYVFDELREDSPQGIYFTDSDDGAVILQYTTLHLDEAQGWWTLDSWQQGAWHIGAVEALRSVPEPTPFRLLLASICVVAAWRTLGCRH